MNGKYIVYMHVSPSGKRYIGLTSNIKNRWRNNGKGYKTHDYFWNAIQKYSWDSFRHIIITGNLSKEAACKLEIELIAHYKTCESDYGYNVTIGGDCGSKGYHYTDEIRYKMSEAHKGKHLSEETRKKLSEIQKGRPKPKSEEWKQEQSKRFKGENNPFYGKKLSEEHKRKISKSLKGKSKNEETRQRMSEAQKRRFNKE